MDLCLNKEESEMLHSESTDEDKKYYKEWHKANKMAKNVIRTTMLDTDRVSIEEPEVAMDFLYAIHYMYREIDKVEAARLSKEFNELKYIGTGKVREHIMKTIEINAQLRDLQIGVNDDHVVHDAVHSLPNSFSQHRTRYNARKEKWSLKELIAICVDEEDKIRKEREPSSSVNLIEKPKKKNQNQSTKGSTSAEVKANKPFRFKW
ncbi:uncharacterized protein LOC133737258 [Rosa rugosa]|uniref:uncharacterized protein LOC133737258 n=1 Tax=Rosa rugosa TaxID=74645 RepID=UPI002B40C1F5|nr:uncharacterized protein LOC133737258 [Rosa rugosa]